MPPQAGPGSQPQGQPPTQGPPGAPQQAPPPMSSPQPQQGGMGGMQGMQSPGMGGTQGQRPQQMQPSAQTIRLEPITAEDIIQEDVVTAERDTPIRTVVAQMREEDVGSVIAVEDGEPVGVVTDRKIALALEETPDMGQQTIEDLADSEPITATPDSNMFDILQLMSDENIRRVPIVDEDGQLQGVVALDDVILVLGREMGNAAEVIQGQIDQL